MLLLPVNEQSSRRSLARTASFEDHARVRVEEAGTTPAAEHGPRHHGIGVPEGVATALSTQRLPLDATFTPGSRTVELTVEGVQLLDLPLEFVLVTLDGLQGDFGVEFLVGHDHSVEHHA